MIYIFGSWFDPVTKAHEAILKKLQKDVMQKDDKLFVCVTQNDEKRDHAPIEQRMAMVKEMLTAKKITADLLNQNQRMWDFLHQEYFKGIKPEDITIVMGFDEMHSLIKGQWKYSARILASYNFIVATRAVGYAAAHEITDVIFNSDKIANYCSVLEINDTKSVSSSAVRDILRKNPECHYKDVQEHISRPVFKFIKNNTLYEQNPANYADIEKKFVEDYKARGWGKFANTVDILAYHDNKVLLIRRKKPPYQGYFALPGGFFDAVDMTDKETGVTVKADIDLEHAAQRELNEETQLDIPAEKFTQIKTYSHLFDPRLRIVDTAFAVRIPAKYAKTACGADDATEACWFNIDDLPKLGFHHEQIIKDWLKTKD